MFTYISCFRSLDRIDHYTKQVERALMPNDEEAGIAHTSLLQALGDLELSYHQLQTLDCKISTAKIGRGRLQAKAEQVNDRLDELRARVFALEVEVETKQRNAGNTRSFSRFMEMEGYLAAQGLVTPAVAKRTIEWIRDNESFTHNSWLYPQANHRAQSTAELWDCLRAAPDTRADFMSFIKIANYLPDGPLTPENLLLCCQALLGIERPNPYEITFVRQLLLSNGQEYEYGRVFNRIEDIAVRVEQDIVEQEALLDSINKQGLDSTFPIQERVIEGMGAIQRSYQELQNAIEWMEYSGGISQDVEQAERIKHHLDALQSYAIRVADSIEEIQRRQIVSATVEPQSHHKLHSISKLLIYAGLDPHNPPAVLGKYLGMYSDNGFTAEDWSTLKAIQENLTARLQSASDPREVEMLGQSMAMVQEVRECMIEAFTTRLQLISQIDENVFAPLDDIGFQSNSVEKRAPTIFAAHDLYWNFNNPLEPSIEMRDFADLWNLLKDDRSIVTEEQSIQLNNTVAWLHSRRNTIFKAACGPGYVEFCKEASDQLLAHKKSYLSGKRTEARRALREGTPINTIIMGGGPGGLARAVTAHIMGANVELFERGHTYTRENMVKLEDHPLLRFLGVTDRLIIGKKIHSNNMNGGFSVQIMELEKAFEELARELAGDRIIHKGSEVVDIRAAIDSDSSRVVTGCLIRQRDAAWGQADPHQAEEAIWRTADIIVDATGTKAQAARILGNQREMLSEASTMIAAVYDTSATAETQPDEATQDIKWSAFLSTPKCQYELILPDDATQASLADLQGRLNEKYAERTQIQRALDKVVAILQKDPEGNIASTSHQQTLRRLLHLTSSPETMMPWSELEGITRERLDSLRQEIWELKAQQSTLTNELARSAVVRDANYFASNPPVEIASPFRVEISRRAPAILLGDALVQQSGDALATPDPISGTGCVTALRGVTLFSRSISDRAKGKTLESQFRNFVYGSEIQTSYLVTHSLSSRQFAAQDYQRTTTTISFFFNRTIHAGLLRPRDAKGFTRLVSKTNDGLPFSHHDRALWDSLRPRLLSAIAREEALRGSSQNDIVKLNEQIMAIDSWVATAA